MIKEEDLNLCVMIEKRDKQISVRIPERVFKALQSLQRDSRVNTTNDLILYLLLKGMKPFKDFPC
jgi:predicted transcriptional regulator